MKILSDIIRRHDDTEMMREDAPGADRPCAILTPIISIRYDDLDSWFGGTPRLPKDTVWPDHDGVPSRFACQINLARLPSGIWEGLGPRDGWLAVFLHPETHAAKVLHVRGEIEERNGPGQLDASWARTYAEFWARLTGPDDDSASLKWLRLALLLMLLIPRESIGGELWPNDFLHFFSLDMRPVEVTMVKANPPGDAPGIRFMLPRAWITFAGGYNPRELDQLPDQILIHGFLQLRLSDPDGKALSLRATEYGRAERIGLNEAVLRLRSDEYGIMLLKAGSPDAKEFWRKNRFKGPETVEKDGLPYDPRTNSYFLLAGDIELASVQCMGRAHPVWFCNYTVWINPNVVAIMTFVDFRTHGGPDFAIARINRALDVMCRQSKVLCQEPEAADIGQSPKE